MSFCVCNLSQNLQNSLIIKTISGFWPYGHGKRGPGDLHGMVFENIRAAAPSVLDEPDILWGMSDGLIYDFVFKNVTIGNETVTGIDHFMHNEYVFDKKPYVF